MPGFKPRHYAAGLGNFSVKCQLCGSALADTLDDPSEKYPTKLTAIHSNPEKMPVLYNQSYTILQGLHIPPMAFTSCHDPRSKMRPLSERAGALNAVNLTCFIA